MLTASPFITHTSWHTAGPPPDETGAHVPVQPEDDMQALEASQVSVV